MAIKTDAAFKVIDDALAEYYQHFSIPNYRDNNGVGLFLNYIKAEELNDPDLPIDEELGDKCDPNDCSYTWIWINNDASFPIPPYAIISYQEKEAFIFYILQFCYKYSKPPSDEHIQQILLLLPQPTENKADIYNRPIPFTKEIEGNYTNINMAEIKKQPENKRDLPGLYVWIPTKPSISQENTANNNANNDELDAVKPLPTIPGSYVWINTAH